ncbi:MAG TPA: pyridoxamine 5'-phosphate oxidase family protein [Anaerolineaceae bacterium]|jgi:nitroimidazol reductase NimA-like FMN-containing flavoprotein (pyridoxamine 5'-phosphate oxidase superfamily)|nr:pyridoxamine 5'-phosphate oxidase family protein [Longilinea sp.]HQL39573.1 pyridoxamine 5'-phosphate oxidase family protein [Anaerolineaceae bacterium]
MKTIPEDKRKLIDAFLEKPLIARMATADRHARPHVVPVWYAWDGTTIWISSFASTRKVAELRENPYLSISIDVAEQNGATRAVILEGKSELITEPREFVASQSYWIYKRYLGDEGVLAKEPQSWIHDPENLLIKLTPEDIYTWEF